MFLNKKVWLWCYQNFILLQQMVILFFNLHHRFVRNKNGTDKKNCISKSIFLFLFPFLLIFPLLYLSLQVLLLGLILLCKLLKNKEVFQIRNICNCHIMGIGGYWFQETFKIALFEIWLLGSYFNILETRYLLLPKKLTLLLFCFYTTRLKISF